MGDAYVDNAAWSYEQPLAEVASIKDMLAFFRERVDAWHVDD